MQIVIYCQYVWGMGHLFRSLELARALDRHQVTLVAGGQEVEVDLPAHVELLRLPPLFMDEFFTTLIPGVPGKSLESIQQERREGLLRLFDRKRPDIFLVELYPFGRTPFGFELVPLLTAVREGRFGNVRCACSIRDVLVEKKDPRAYEQRVVETLNRFFDLLLIHSDERLLPLDGTFGALDAVRIPKVYTGFVGPRPDPARARGLRRKLSLGPAEKLVVASAGGGRSGFRLLAETLAACRELRRRLPLKLELFTGPFMSEGEFRELHSRAEEGLSVRRFTARLVDYLSAADLSISLAGYNTCMNLLATGVPALVLPYSRQQEQPLRVDKIKPFLPLVVLTEADLQAARMTELIAGHLARGKRAEPAALNLDGAANTARFIESWADPTAAT